MRVEAARQIVEIKGQPVRLMRLRGTFDQARIFGELLDERDLALVGQPRAAAFSSARSKFATPSCSAACRNTEWQRADAYCT